MSKVSEVYTMFQARIIVAQGIQPTFFVAPLLQIEAAIKNAHPDDAGKIGEVVATRDLLCNAVMECVRYADAHGHRFYTLIVDRREPEDQKSA